MSFIFLDRLQFTKSHKHSFYIFDNSTRKINVCLTNLFPSFLIPLNRTRSGVEYLRSGRFILFHPSFFSLESSLGHIIDCIVYIVKESVNVWCKYGLYLFVGRTEVYRLRIYRIYNMDEKLRIILDLSPS